MTRRDEQAPSTESTGFLLFINQVGRYLCILYFPIIYGHVASSSFAFAPVAAGACLSSALPQRPRLMWKSPCHRKPPVHSFLLDEPGLGIDGHWSDMSTSCTMMASEFPELHAQPGAETPGGGIGPVQPGQPGFEAGNPWIKVQFLMPGSTSKSHCTPTSTGMLT